jgi:hypothetical protein
LEDVRCGVPQQTAHLRTLQHLVETEHVPSVRLAGAVVGVPLDLDRQPLLPEEEVKDDAASLRGDQLDLALGPEVGVEHAQAGDGLGRRSGARVTKPEPTSGPCRSLEGA